MRLRRKKETWVQEGEQTSDRNSKQKGSWKIWKRVGHCCIGTGQWHKETKRRSAMIVKTMILKQQLEVKKRYGADVHVVECRWNCRYGTYAYIVGCRWNCLYVRVVEWVELLLWYTCTCCGMSVELSLWLLVWPLLSNALTSYNFFWH